jgi:hypothetical protein
MEYLALAVILYFILRTMGNLVRLLGGSSDAASGQDARPEAPARREGWEGPSPRQQTGAAREEPTFWGEDIEDATWRDL